MKNIKSNPSEWWWNNGENAPEKKRWAHPLLWVLRQRNADGIDTDGIKIIAEINSLMNNQEIIDYLVNNVKEEELKNYIEYFLSKAEEIEFPKWEENTQENIAKFLLEKSKKWENIYFKKFDKRNYYSLWFEHIKDISEMNYLAYKRGPETRADRLVNKIKEKKKINKALQSIPNVIEKWKKYIKDEELSQHFNKIMNLIEKMLNNRIYKDSWLAKLYDIKKWLQYLKEIENWENRENIKSKIEKEECGHVLPFLIMYIDKQKTDIFLNCAKMEHDRYIRAFPYRHSNPLEDLWLTNNATIVDIANKRRESLLENDRNYRSNIEKKLSEDK